MSSNFTPGPWEDIAHLIAAAPDMCAALLNIVNDSDHHGVLPPLLRDEAEAALAKARGEQP